MHKTLIPALALTALLLAPSVAAARSYSPDLSCAAAYPVVSLGNSGRFVAVSSAPGPFTWTTDDMAFVDAGEVFVAPMTRLGVQDVTVVWGSKRSTCYVRVVPEPGYGEVALYSNTPLHVTLTSVLFPFLPNTGFAPASAAALAFAVVLLLGSGIALYPHARKAFAIVLR